MNRAQTNVSQLSTGTGPVEMPGLLDKGENGGENEEDEEEEEDPNLPEVPSSRARCLICVCVSVLHVRAR